MKEKRLKEENNHHFPPFHSRSQCVHDAHKHTHSHIHGFIQSVIFLSSLSTTFC